MCPAAASRSNMIPKARGQTPARVGLRRRHRWRMAENTTCARVNGRGVCKAANYVPNTSTTATRARGPIKQDNPLFFAHVSEFRPTTWSPTRSTRWPASARKGHQNRWSAGVADTPKNKITGPTILSRSSSCTSVVAFLRPGDRAPARPSPPRLYARGQVKWTSTVNEQGHARHGFPQRNRYLRFTQPGIAQPRYSPLVHEISEKYD